MNTITLAADKLRWAARVALKAASTDDVTPVLTTVHFVSEGGRLRLEGTDRYRVHQAFVDLPEGSPDGEFLMQRGQVQWMLNAVHRPVRARQGQVIRLSWINHEPKDGLGAGTVHVESFAHNPGEDTPVFSYRSFQVPGVFPPMHRLFPELTDFRNEMLPQWAMNPTFLADLRVLQSHRDEPLRFFTPRTSPYKIAPIVVTNYEGTARALVQRAILPTDVAEYRP